MPIKTIQHRHITWTNVTRPTPEDVEALRAWYVDFHPLDLEDLVSHIERPKLDQYEDYLFTVMHFPLWEDGRRLSRSSEVSLFLGEGYLVTVHEGALRPILSLFERCMSDEKIRDQHMGQGASRLFYTVIDQLVDHIFPLLLRIDAQLHRIEDDIFTRDTRRMIREITLLRRDNIALLRILRPQLEILYTLERVERPFMREELDLYFGDIRDHLLKAVDQISEHKDIIVGLSDTLNTLASYRTNEIVQILTMISVILMPLTVLTGMYGMNVGLPFQNHPQAFLLVCAMMLFTALGMLVFFRIKEWL